MNYEKLVVLKTLEEHEAGRDKAFKQVLDRGVDASFFIEHPKYWTFMNQHKKNYGSFPTVDTFQKHFRFKDLPELKEPMDFYLDGLVKEKRRSIVLTAVDEMDSFFEKDKIEAGISRLKSALKQIDSTFKSNDLSMPNSVDDRFLNYEYRANNPGIDGIPSGLPKLDGATYGWHGGEFIVLHAFLGSYKSWVLLYMVHEAMKAGFRPLIATVEMGQLQIARRLDSILTGTEFDKLRSGQFKNNKELMDFKARMDKIKTMPECVVIGGVSFGELFLRAKLDEHAPDILFIDGIYLMEDDSGAGKAQWEQLNTISRNLKLVAEDYNIPVFATTQAWKSSKKPGSKGDESVDQVAFSGGMMQNADVGVSLGRIYDPVIEEFTNKLWVKLTKLREGEPVKFQVEIDFDLMELREVMGIADNRTKIDTENDSDYQPAGGGLKEGRDYNVPVAQFEELSDEDEIPF